MQLGTEFPNEYIIISSHYDHPDGPGADDNASGTAGVLECARILSQYEFKRTILYMPFNIYEYPALYIGDIEYKSKNIHYHQRTDTIGAGVNCFALAQGFVKATIACRRHKFVTSAGSVTLLTARDSLLVAPKR